jgi:hypothetical protein
MELGLLGAAEGGLVADAAPEAQALPRPGSGRLGVVTALQTEADCLRQLPEGRGPLIHVSGGSAMRARAGAEGLREKGVVALVSFGLAIGLAPVLRPVTWCSPTVWSCRAAGALRPRRRGVRHCSNVSAT